jgi:poly(ADP-ribose) glycohydrolase
VPATAALPAAVIGAGAAVAPAPAAHPLWPHADHYLGVLASAQFVDETSSAFAKQNDQALVALFRDLGTLNELAPEKINLLPIFDEVDHGGPECRRLFFHHAFPLMRALVGEAAVLFPQGLPRLPAQFAGVLHFSRRQVACILSGLFFNFWADGASLSHTHDEKEERFGVDIFFSKLYPSDMAKVRMFLNYFLTLARTGVPDGTISFLRQILQPPGTVEVENVPLTPVAVHAAGKMEAAAGPDALIVDFAARHLGGGVLSSGCVQEEIMFSEHPEMLIGKLVCDGMDNNEAIVIIGAQQFSLHTGYRRDTLFAGDCDDPLTRVPRDALGRLQRKVIAIDATFFGHYAHAQSHARGQFTLPLICREYYKALAGFGVAATDVTSASPRIVTGNWGCGAFGGSVPLKFIIQWLACTKARRSMEYFAFGDPASPALTRFAQTLQSAGVTHAQLWAALNSVIARHGADPAVADRLLQWLERQLGL